MTMIDGSYSFTDISRKVFAGLAGQSGRSFPACAALAGNAWRRAPPQPAARSAACSEGRPGPLPLWEPRDTLGLRLVQEIPRGSAWKPRFVRPCGARGFTSKYRCSRRGGVCGKKPTPYRNVKCRAAVCERAAGSAGW